MRLLKLAGRITETATRVRIAFGTVARLGVRDREAVF
jgi:hypothetical protein